MDIRRNVSIAPTIIAALKPRHSVLQHLQQFIHLYRMQLPDLINEQDTPMGFADRPGTGSGDTRIAKGSCPLINGIMDRTHQGIGNIPFIKLQRGGIDLHKFRLAPKG